MKQLREKPSGWSRSWGRKKGGKTEKSSEANDADSTLSDFMKTFVLHQALPLRASGDERPRSLTGSADCRTRRWQRPAGFVSAQLASSIMPLSPAAFGRSGVFVGHPHPVAAEESLGFLIFCLGSVAVLRGHLNVGNFKPGCIKLAFFLLRKHFGTSDSLLSVPLTVR